MRAGTGFLLVKGHGAFCVCGDATGEESVGPDYLHIPRSSKFKLCTFCMNVVLPVNQKMQ